MAGLITSHKLTVRTDQRAKLALPVNPGHKFTDRDLSFDHAGTQPVVLSVPRLSGMTELVVNRARFSMQAVAVERPPVSGDAASSSATHRVTLDAGTAASASLVRVVIKRLSLASPGQRCYLSAGSGTFVYAADGGEATRAAAIAGDRPLFVLLRPRVGGSATPPARSFPAFAMPGNNSLYGAVLAGIDGALDHPAQDAITFTINPPLDATSVDIFIGMLASDDAKGPNDLSAVNWSAAAVQGVFGVVPHDLEIAADGGGQTPAVASFPGALPTRRSDLDCSPAARAVLTATYAQDSATDLPLSLSFQSKSAGQLHLTATTIDTFYRFAAVPKDGLAVSMRGGLLEVPLALPGPYAAATFNLTLDGAFGPGALIADSDRAPNKLLHGFSLTGDVCVARRVTLEAAERGRPLLRVSAWGRAVADCDLLFELRAGADDHIDRLLAAPVSLKLTASASASWQRVQLTPDPALLPHPSTLWIVVRASRGAFLWYGDDTSSAVTQCSSDTGRSWTQTPGRPCLQLHKQTPVTELAALELWLGEQRISSDLLKAPAASSRFDVARIDAARLQRQASDPGSAQLSPSSTASSNAGFRIAGLAPFDAATLAGLAANSGKLALAFDCRRDADFKIIDASFTYDPWSAKVP